MLLLHELLKADREEPSALFHLVWLHLGPDPIHHIRGHHDGGTAHSIGLVDDRLENGRDELHQALLEQCLGSSTNGSAAMPPMTSF